jgi:hypothetical protein
VADWLWLVESFAEPQPCATKGAKSTQKDRQKGNLPQALPPVHHSAPPREVGARCFATR